MKQMILPAIAHVWRFVTAAVRAAVNTFLEMLGSLVEIGERWLFTSKKALHGLAVTRILLGSTAFGLLLANFSTRLYTFGSGSAWNGELAEPRSDFVKIWLFSSFHRVAGNDLAFTALYVLLMILAVLFVLGWRFRLVLPVFFVLWVSFIEMNDMVGDQGDNMFRITLMILFFTDPAAKWSLDARRRAKREWFPPGTSGAYIGTVLHNLGLVALTAQVCFVYAAGGLYKAQGQPWAGGWAVYDPLHTMRFGTWPVLSDLITQWGPMVTIATWGSIIIQVAFLLMLLSTFTRRIALIAILSFHIAIGVLMGLPWFSLTMIAIDSIFIREKSWARLDAAARRLWRGTAAKEDADGTAQDAAPAATETVGAR